MIGTSIIKICHELRCKLCFIGFVSKFENRHGVFFLLNFLLLIIPLLSLSCGHRQVVRYEATSYPETASIYADGKKVCEETPCQFQLNADHVFVGLRNTSDGVVCEGKVTLDVIPTKKTPMAYNQQVGMDSCLDREKELTNINFDLRVESKVSSVLATKAKLIQFGSVGAHVSSWSYNNFPRESTRRTDFSLSYGKQIWAYPGFVLLGEIVASKRSPLETDGYRVGAFGHFHSTEVSFLFLTTGLVYQSRMNEFAVDGFHPFVGGGILLNQKSLYAFSRYLVASRNDGNFQIGSLGFDISIFGGVFRNSKLGDWDSQSTFLGFRFYF